MLAVIHSPALIIMSLEMMFTLEIEMIAFQYKRHMHRHTQGPVSREFHRHPTQLAVLAVHLSSSHLRADSWHFNCQLTVLHRILIPQLFLTYCTIKMTEYLNLSGVNSRRDRVPRLTCVRAGVPRKRFLSEPLRSPGEFRRLKFRKSHELI